MTSFADVVQAWSNADVKSIHPLRAVDEDAYWESGEAQAADASLWAPDSGLTIDFGCGDGRIAIPLAQLGLDVLAVDASSEMLSRLQARARELGVSVPTFQSDGTDLSRVIKDPVGLIVCRAVLIHHDHAGVERLVKQFAKVLQPGGYLVADWPIGAHRARRDWIDITTWSADRRETVASRAGLTLVDDSTPGVWQKI